MQYYSILAYRTMIFFERRRNFGESGRCESDEKMKKNEFLKYSVSVAIAVVLLYFSFRDVNWSDFYDGLRNCKWEWIGVAMLAGVASFWFRAVRWRQFLLPIDSTTSRKVTFNAINIGNFANLVLPRVGEFVRCGFITRHSASDEKGRLASYDKVLGTVVAERSLDVITLLSLVLVMTICMWNRFGTFLTDNIFQPFSEKFNLGFGLLLAVVAAVMLIAVLAVWKFRTKSKVFAKVSGFAEGLVKGLVSCFKMKNWWLFVLNTVIIWTMYWLMSFSVLIAVKFMDVAALSPEMADSVCKLSELGALDALFLMLVGSLSSLVPIPGGFGAFHYIVALALSSVYGVPFPTGIMFATLSHESQTITMIVTGLCSYASESADLRK